MAQPQQDHPIFHDIRRGDLAAVQQRVLADRAVLGERNANRQDTPLIHAVVYKKAAIALWLIEHRNQHDLEAREFQGWTALLRASDKGLLEVLQALVSAGANPAAVNQWRNTPLIFASIEGHTDIVAFLLQLPAVKASIDHINQYPGTALSCASRLGRQHIVQILLDAGADPTIPVGPHSALNEALVQGYSAIAALLRHPIAEADRARALHKIRSLLGAGAASLACLRGRVEHGQAPPTVELPPKQQQYQGKNKKNKMKKKKKERVRAAALFVVGLSGGEKDTGLCEDLYVKLQEYMLPVWADKGPEA